MRLTLRTLLAYLDDILEPGDRAGLEQKIQESEFAKKLIERTRDVVVQPQLGASAVVGRGVVRDANSVAEYLDNTMAPEQVQEFERVCLESDVHLAEVTGCHNILTIVLGKPAQVTASMRERMYRLNEGTVMQLSDTEMPIAEDADALTTAIASRDTPPPSSSDTVTNEPTESLAAVAPPAAPDFGSPENQPAAASDSRFWLAMMSTAVVAAAATGILFIAYDRFAGEPAEVVVNDEANGAEVPGDQIPVDEAGTLDLTISDDANPAIERPPVSVDTPGGLVPGQPVDSPEEMDEPTIVNAIDPALDPLPEPSPAPAKDVQDGIELAGPAGNAEPPLDLPAPVEDPPVSNDPPGEPPSNEPAEPPASNDGGEPPVATQDPLGQPMTKSPDSDRDAEGGEPDATGEPAPPAAVGRLLSEDQVLLRTDHEMETITRLPKQADLRVGDRLISLPAFRPLISAASNTMELDGGTSLAITGFDNQVPEIDLHYGRVLIRSLPFPDSRLRVRVGDRTATLVYEQPDSVVGIEVRPHRKPGTDPEHVPSEHAVDLYVVSGVVKWISDNQEETIQAPNHKRLSVHRNDEETVLDEQPAWLVRSTITALDRRGVSTIQQKLQHDRSVSLSLSELAQPSQRFEVRRLALRGCAYVAYFDPLIDGLSDKEEFNRWFTIFLPELTAAIARDPQTAAKVRRTLERKRGDDAEELYRMLWGYSREDLLDADDPQAPKLVEYLNHEDLDYRVLSIWNLRQITGLGLNYRPEDSESDRRQSVLRWQKKASRGEIVPKGSEPDPAAKK